MALDRGTIRLSSQDENELAAQLARLALEQAAPEELVLFAETAAEYFRNPRAMLESKQGDDPLGFGLDLALLTPYLLAVATAVVRFLASTVADTAMQESKPVIARLVHRLLRRSEPAAEPAGEVTPLSIAQARQVREIAYQRAKSLGLDEDHAVLLADSVVGGLVR